MSTKRERMKKAAEDAVAEIARVYNSGETKNRLNEILATATSEQEESETSDSIENIDKELIQMIAALTPEQAESVKEFISKLKSEKKA